MSALRQPDPSPDRPNGDGVEQELLQALRDELSEERARKESLERRGLSVAAGSATATALLFGLGADYSGRWQLVFFAALTLGGLCFLMSAFFGWRISALRKYSEIDIDALERIRAEGWSESIEDFRAYLAAGVYDTIKEARTNNDTKARFYEVALKFLLAGLGSVVALLIIVFLDSVLPGAT